MVADGVLRGSEGLRPLYIAAQEGHCKIISLLIEKGANVHGLEQHDPNHEGYTALHIAANSSQFNCLKLLVDVGADVNRGLTDRAGSWFPRGTTALDMLLQKAGTHISPHVSPIRMLAKAGAMPSSGFDWDYCRTHMSPGTPAFKRSQAVTRRWRAYFAKLLGAGGFDAHARDERQKLVVIADKFLGLDLVPQVIPIIVEFWGHPGDPWLSFLDYPARGPPS